MTTANIWFRAQVAALLLALPVLIFPPFYLVLAAITVIFGLPAIPLFYLLLKLMKYFFTNSKPVTKWVAAMACLPGMLLITGACVLAATCFLCCGIDNRFEWELSLFGLPAMLGTVISVCISRKDIYQFIYIDRLTITAGHHLYADMVKKHTP